MANPKNLSEAVDKLIEKRDNAASEKIGDTAFARYSAKLDSVILTPGEDMVVLRWKDYENLKRMMEYQRKMQKG